MVRVSPLLTDLYHLNMVQSYLDAGLRQIGVFEFFVRALPKHRNFLVCAGLEQIFELLEGYQFTRRELDWIEGSGRFGRNLVNYLAGFRFSGDIHAIPEGTVFFADEPILRVTAPLPEAQLLETQIINVLHFQSLIASKAARMVLAAQGRRLVDFGLRRAHSADAGLSAARASYIAGFAGSATVLAEKRYGIPIFGTMAHSYVEAFDNEVVAFERFAKSRPENLTLLIDTYDTLNGARKVVMLAPRLRELGIMVRSVRIDSGDLGAAARDVRAILDEGGLSDVGIFVSGGLDEIAIRDLVLAGAPIDGFGVGTSLATSFDAPALDCAYKLQEYAGIARRKRSAGKATWPGRKQVWRGYSADGRMAGDAVSVEDDEQEGEPLVEKVMESGRRCARAPTLDDIRQRTARDLARLPDALRSLEASATYRVEISGRLQQLAAEVDRRLARSGGNAA